MREAIAEAHQPRLWELAREHGVDYKTVDVTLELNDAGEVTRCEIDPPNEADESFEKALRQQILGWKFASITRAGISTFSLSLAFPEVEPPDWHMFEMAPPPLEGEER